MATAGHCACSERVALCEIRRSRKWRLTIDVGDSVDGARQEFEKRVSENCNVREYAHGLVTCPCCRGVQYAAVIQFRYAIRVGSVRKLFPNATHTPLSGDTRGEGDAGTRADPQCPLKRKSYLAGEAAPSAATGASAAAADQPVSGAAAGVDGALPRQPFAAEAAAGRDAAGMERCMAELAATTAQAVARLKAEAEHARAASEAEIGHMRAQLRGALVQVERARAESKSTTENMRSQIDAVAAILQTATSIKMGAERAQSEAEGTHTKAGDNNTDPPHYIAMLKERMSGRSTTRLACIVLDHVGDNYSPVAAREPPPAALELGGARGRGIFTVTQCETMLIGWQPAIHESIVRAREVFRFVVHGRHLSPVCTPGDGCYVEVYIEKGVVAFFNRTTRRGAKWALDDAGMWHVAARM